MSDHGWTVLSTLLTPICVAVAGLITAWHTRKSSKKIEKKVDEKTDELMLQNMRGFLVQVFSGDVDVPDDSVYEMYKAYYKAGGNGELRDMALEYTREMRKRREKNE